MHEMYFYAAYELIIETYEFQRDRNRGNDACFDTCFHQILHSFVSLILLDKLNAVIAMTTQSTVISLECDISIYNSVMFVFKLLIVKLANLCR